MYYNIHIHTFTEQDIPRRFLPLKLVRVLASKTGFSVLANILNNINPFSDKDMFDRYVIFIGIGKLGSQQKIFERCMQFYPENNKFVVLAMDMAFMGAGKVPNPYEKQLEELAALKRTYPQIRPFIHIDPRRENAYDLLRKSMEEWGFNGIKIYPPLGYFPYDERLYPVYEYCTKHNLPVIAHSSPFNPVHYKGKKKEIIKLLEKSRTAVDTQKKNKKELCSYFTHPRNYQYVLQDFKDLRISFAHFGSSYFWEKYLDNPAEKDNWFRIIKNMMKKNPNLYADISFTLYDKEFFSLLKVLLTDEKLKKQILFGSDYYMVQTETVERRFSLDLRAYLGEDIFNTVALHNPKAFLSE